MPRIAFYGVLHTGDPFLIADVLGAWVKAGKLPHKVRLGGVEMTHEDAGVYLYCHEDSVAPERPPQFLLEGHREGTLDEARAALVVLRDALGARQVPAKLEYVEVDEDGQELSDQFSLSP